MSINTQVNKYVINRGDDDPIEVTLHHDGQTFAMTTGDTVTAGLVNRDGLILAGTVDLTHNNADLANSKFVVSFTSAQTSLFPLGDCYMQVKREGLTYNIYGLVVREGYV